jgi:phosphoesterase RecJ-like protein
MGIKEVAGAIKKYNGYIITSHINIEGDAIGSELALLHLIRQLGKSAVIVNDNYVPDRYRFLPGWDKIIVGDNGKLKGYENIITVDCPTIERSGKIAQLVYNSKIKINIDHHISNVNFGDFNWVDLKASSCGEMIFNLYKELGLSISEEVATILYVAILTDTGSFRYDSTTSKTHQIAGELVRLGVKSDKIAEKVYGTKTLGDIELLSKALSTVKTADNGRIAYMHVTKKMLNETDTTPDRTDGFINFAKDVGGSEISIFFREDIEDAKKIHVGFRSKGSADVNMLANKFGGGGHPKASGCLITGNLEKVIKKVLKVAEEFLL